VLAPVAGEERHPPAADLADGDRCRRRTERRVDHDLFDVVEQRVQARAAVDPDVGAPGRRADGHDETEVELLVEPESLDDEDDPPSELEEEDDEDEPLSVDELPLLDDDEDDDADRLSFL
jgi:hypothetical protein